jgi:hypothetical protein
MSAVPPKTTDDMTIADDSQLWRRVPPWHLIEDKNLGTVRPSSAAFDDPAGSSMSVVLGNEVLAAGRDPSSVLAGHDGFYLASVTAAHARSLQQAIVRMPIHDEPAHAEVVGKKTRGVQRSFAKAATWIIPPNAGQTT